MNDGIPINMRIVLQVLTPEEATRRQAKAWWKAARRKFTG